MRKAGSWSTGPSSLRAGPTPPATPARKRANGDGWGSSGGEKDPPDWKHGPSAFMKFAIPDPNFADDFLVFRSRGDHDQHPFRDRGDAASPLARSPSADPFRHRGSRPRPVGRPRRRNDHRPDPRLLVDAPGPPDFPRPLPRGTDRGRDSPARLQEQQRDFRQWR